MSKFVGIIIGAVEITVGVILEFVPAMRGLGTFLIISGAGQLIGGVGTLLSQPQGGLTVATRNPVAPWNVVYGKTKVGGTIIYINESGDHDKYLDLVIVVAAHACDAVEALLFDNQRIQIDPATGCSFTPVQQTVSISSITRSHGVVTVVLPADIPLLTDGDQLQIKNVTSDRTLNGIYPVTVVSQTHGAPGTVTFSYICGGADVAITSQGQAKTRWADYRAKVYFEALLGTQTATFAGMLNGTPYDGDTGNLIQPNPNPWTAAHLCSGKTVAFLRLHYNDEVFTGGIPNISFRVRGKNDIFDPRTGTSGYTNNAALCIADYLHAKWGFSAAYSTEVPDAQLVAAANICDESVALASGASQARYTCDGTFQLNRSRGELLQNLLTSCGGRITFVGGQFVIWPAAWSLSTNLSIGCGRNVTAATLHVWSDYDGGTAPAGIAQLLIQFSVDRGLSWSTLVDTLSPSVTAYSLRDDSLSVSLSYVDDLRVRAKLSHSLYQDPINSQARIYDMYVQVTFADGTSAQIRPAKNTFTLYAGNNTLGQPNGTITSPELAYDADSSPPATYATIITRRTAPLAASDNAITWTGFADPSPDTQIMPALTGPVEWHPRVPIRELYNSVKGTYVSPTNSWQPSDFPPYAQDALHGYASDANLAADGGDRRYKEIQLPFTTNASRAQRLAKIELLRRRQQGVGTFRFNMKAYKFTALDVVKFTFPFFSWNNKLLEVLAHRLTLDKQGDESVLLGVEMEMQETDPSVYDWSSSEELTPQGFQSSNVPGIVPGATGPSGAVPPTSVVAASSSATSVVNADGISTPRILVTWNAPADAYTTAILAQYQLAGASTWTDLVGTPSPVTQFYISSGIVVGQQYNIQIRATNRSGGLSVWVPASPFPVTVAGTQTALATASLSTAGAITGQALVFNGTSYAPATLSTGGTWDIVTPTGTLDGTNKIFTVPHTPVGVFMLYLGGVLQHAANYSRSGVTITFTVAPKARDAGYMTAIYTY